VPALIVRFRAAGWRDAQSASCVILTRRRVATIQLPAPTSSHLPAVGYHRFVNCTRLTLAVSLLTLLSACNSGGRPARIGETAPNFTITDSRRTVTLSQLRGKPVILNFWASWCAPCVEEMPSLVELQKKLGDRVTVLAVSEDADNNAFEQFVRDHNIDFLAVRDPRQSVNELYGTFKFPETYVIDKDGKIVRKFIGATDWASPDLVDYFNKL